MGSPLDYRNAVPDMSSSSPLHSMAAISSSPPLSPQSSPSSSRAIASAAAIARSRSNGLLSPTNSNPHPFSGSAKATTGSHPSFGKDQLRSKHLRSGGIAEEKRAVVLQTWKLSHGPALDSNISRKAAEEALEHHFFDSSDDNLSSDWSGAVDHQSASTAPSSMQNALPHIGLGIESEPCIKMESRSRLLGLGPAFREPTSPSAGRTARVRTFSRTQSSNQDPFSAGAGSSLSTANASSPRGQRVSQRRRLTGSSPKKLSTTSSYMWDGSSDEDVALWEKSLTQSRSIGSHWRSAVEQVFDKVDGAIELTKQGLYRIDPVVADLANFVSIPHLRTEDNLSRAGGLSRSSSTLSNFERCTSATSVVNSPSVRFRSQFGDGQSSNSQLRIFLASNRIKVFSSALFDLHNLVVLTIRDNGIEELPAAIGNLVNLRELNVSQNRLRYLPAEIQKLRLNSLLHFPNPFELPPSKAFLSLRRPFGQRHGEGGNNRAAATVIATSMGPPALPARAGIRSHFASRPSFAMAGIQSSAAASCPATELGDIQGSARYLAEGCKTPARLPSLMDLCVRVLLEPEDNADKGMLLEQFESGSLVRLNKNLDASLIRSLEAARRCSSKVWGRVRPGATREETWCSGIRGRDSSALLTSQGARKSAISAFAGDPGEASNEESGEEEGKASYLPALSIEEQLDRGDDSRHNPWFNRCPNPCHYRDRDEGSSSSRNSHDTQGTAGNGDWPGLSTGGRIFFKPCVERLEWVSHIAGVMVTQLRLEEVAAAQGTKTPVAAQDANVIPLLWRGCGPSCLDFLETEM